MNERGSTRGLINEKKQGVKEVFTLSVTCTTPINPELTNDVKNDLRN